MTRALRFTARGAIGGALDCIEEADTTTDLKIGQCGATKGAAAALIAAARRPEPTGAIVSRGARPDLAAKALADVQAPTLLIVGEQDTLVVEFTGRHGLRAPGTRSHLFEEPGSLDQVTSLAIARLKQRLGRRSNN